jgi:hypothetical protein
MPLEGLLCLAGTGMIIVWGLMGLFFMGFDGFIFYGV